MAEGGQWGGCPAAHINHVRHFYINSQNRIQITLADTCRPRPNIWALFIFHTNVGAVNSEEFIFYIQCDSYVLSQCDRCVISHTKIFLVSIFLRYYFILFFIVVVVEQSGNVIIATRLRMIFRVKENDGVLVKRSREN